MSSPGKAITQIVLNGRDFAQLATLSPGVSNQTGQDEGTVGVYGNVSMSINGGRTENNAWELDGGDDMDNGSNQTLNVYPSADAIGEFRVLTSNYGAQYGRNGSGTIETSIKSGGKDFHGDVYEFVRNNDFNARNFFQQTVPEYRKNDFGYTLGGPVYIPKVYNKDKNKTFFFFSEEWRKDLVPGQTFNQPLPDVQQQMGNFADVCPAAGSIVNKTGFPDCPVNPKTHSYFPNNIVPIDPNAAAILTLLPQPNSGSGLSSRYFAAPAQLTNWREELVRIDHNFSDKVRMFGHFIHDSWSTETPTPLWGNGASFPTVGTNFVGPGVSIVANLAANFSPTLLNEFTFAYTTDHIFLNAVGPTARPSSMTMTGLFNNGFGGLLPAVSVGAGVGYDTGGFSLDTGYFPWNNANPTYTYKDQVTKIMGSHNFTFGASYVAAQKNEQNSPYVQGVLATSNYFRGKHRQRVRGPVAGRLLFLYANQLQAQILQPLQDCGTLLPGRLACDAATYFESRAPSKFVRNVSRKVLSRLIASTRRLTRWRTRRRSTYREALRGKRALWFRVSAIRLTALNSAGKTECREVA